MKSYNEFINESKTIDLSRIDKKNGITFWLHPKVEDLLMEITGLEIPKYPEQGDIMLCIEREAKKLEMSVEDFSESFNFILNDSRIYE